jgi:nucleoside-diphosphate-sugar epimerase
MLSEIIIHDIENICGHIDHDFLTNKKVLITGASGLIGTYTLAYMASLIKAGVPLEVYAQTFSEPPPHMLELISCGKIKVLQMDLSNINEYERLPDADVIIHSAGYAQPMLFMRNPVATMQINISATMALLQRLRPQGSFVFISSSEVYCGLKDSIFQEDCIGTTTPYHPRASYIEGKRSGEAFCNSFRSQGVRAISARLGDVYGPGTRKHDKRALNSFIEKALLNQKIDLLDSGTAMRTYCYVADALEFLMKILFYGKQAVYNVGSHSYTSIAGLAKMIGEITNVPVVFPSDESQVAGAPEILQLDLSRVETEFGKTEYVELEEGLKRTIAWQRELYGKEQEPA